eukprot:TRINITY_DN2494_c0_g1_i2.p1 TRINITY_DN2494_c0_g1~~TRINITY_DN2494_c0_g1_i2.p1  ORF type:complete len:140 (-),score=18.75 TRINITY_DN2494_c0_g1_i2:1261-1680(-)
MPQKAAPSDWQSVCSLVVIGQRSGQTIHEDRLTAFPLNTSGLFLTARHPLKERSQLDRVKLALYILLDPHAVASQFSSYSAALQQRPELFVEMQFVRSAWNRRSFKGDFCVEMDPVRINDGAWVPFSFYASRETATLRD